MTTDHLNWTGISTEWLLVYDSVNEPVHLKSSAILTAMWFDHRPHVKVTQDAIRYLQACCAHNCGASRHVHICIERWQHNLMLMRKPYFWVTILMDFCKALARTELLKHKKIEICISLPNSFHFFWGGGGWGGGCLSLFSYIYKFKAFSLTWVYMVLFSRTLNYKENIWNTVISLRSSWWVSLHDVIRYTDTVL